MEQQELNLIKQLKDLRRFKGIIILMIMVAGRTSWGFTAAQPPVYEVTATVMVEGGQQGWTCPQESK